jgi:phage shock protein E
LWSRGGFGEPNAHLNSRLFAFSSSGAILVSPLANMKTSPSTTFTFRLLALAAVVAAGCSSNGDSDDSDDEVCLACATAGSGGSAGGGASSTALGGSSTSGSVGGRSSTGGASASAGTSSAFGGTAASAGGASATPERCSVVTGAVAQALVLSGATLLDVRTASEFATDGLPGAINIPLAELATRMSELDLGKNIVVYCASGNRAGQATTQLCDGGYSVFNLGARSNWPQ